MFILVVRKIHSSSEDEEGIAPVAMGDPDEKIGITATMTAVRLTTSRIGFERMVLCRLFPAYYERRRKGGRQMSMNRKEMKITKENEGAK